MHEEKPQLTRELVLSLLPRNELERKIIVRRMRGMDYRQIAQDLKFSDFKIIHYHKLAKIKIACCLVTRWEKYQL